MIVLIQLVILTYKWVFSSAVLEHLPKTKKPLEKWLNFISVGATGFEPVTLCL